MPSARASSRKGSISWASPPTRPGDGADGLLGALVTPQVGDVADGQGPGVVAMPILVGWPGDIEDLVVDRKGNAPPLPEPPVVPQDLRKGGGDNGAPWGTSQVAPQSPVPPPMHTAVRRAGTVLGDGQSGTPALGGVAADVDAGEHRVGVNGVGNRLSPTAAGGFRQAANRLLIEPYRSGGHRASHHPVPGQNALGDRGHRAAHDDDPLLDIHRQLAACLPEGDRLQGDDAHSHPAALKHARLVAEEGTVVGAVPVRVPRGSEDNVHVTAPHRSEKLGAASRSRGRRTS